MAAVLVGAVLAGGCGASGSPAQQVRSWATGAAWPGTMTQLRGDLDRLAGIGTEAAGVRRTVCDVLVTDALDANQQLPAPDAILNSLLAGAYAAAATAGRECFNGGASLAAVPGEQQKALRGLVQAQARYDQLITALSSSR